MPLKLPRLISGVAIVDQQGKPNGSMIQWWQQVVGQIEQAIALIVRLAGIQDQFEQALMQAQQATQQAKDAADAAAAAAAAAKREAALQGSYIMPSSVLTATPTTITIANHTRYYPQPSGDSISVPVMGGTVSATGSGDTDYISYNDPMRAGGNVTYIVSTDAPTQTGDTHVVGAVLIPDTGTADGGDGPRRPGFVQAKEVPTQQTQ